MRIAWCYIDALLARFSWRSNLDRESYQSKVHGHLECGNVWKRPSLKTPNWWMVSLFQPEQGLTSPAILRWAYTRHILGQPFQVIVIFLQETISHETPKLTISGYILASPKKRALHPLWDTLPHGESLVYLLLNWAWNGQSLRLKASLLVRSANHHLFGSNPTRFQFMPVRAYTPETWTAAAQQTICHGTQMDILKQPDI